MQEFLAGVGVAAIAAGGWFGNFIGNFRPPMDGKAPQTQVASTTREGQQKPMRQGAKADPACVRQAVEAREEALADAVRTYGDAVADAYDARAAAVASAYAASSDEGIRTSLKAAWDAFKTASKTARDAWNGTQRAAWKAFESSVKSCGTTAVTDSANATADSVAAPIQ